LPIPRTLVALLLCSAFALSQPAKAAPAASTSGKATLPIVFTKTVSADKARTGDIVHAKTTQVATLPSGEVVPAGTEVTGHVVAAGRFVYDKTPYAKQKESRLTIKFDSLRLAGKDVALKVMVRAMADPLTSWGAREPKSSDLDSLGTVTQIGGDQLVPSQSEVVSLDGDVVAYNRRNGVYAHLIAHRDCDGSDNEVSVGIYSPSACGLYGFVNIAALEMGSGSAPSTVSLVSTRTSPKVWRSSTALLEVISEAGAAR
jgi:hypothetical protein